MCPHPLLCPPPLKCSVLTLVGKFCIPCCLVVFPNLSLMQFDLCWIYINNCTKKKIYTVFEGFCFMRVKSEKCSSPKTHAFFFLPTERFLTNRGNGEKTMWATCGYQEPWLWLWYCCDTCLSVKLVWRFVAYHFCDSFTSLNLQTRQLHPDI